MIILYVLLGLILLLLLYRRLYMARRKNLRKKQEARRRQAARRDVPAASAKRGTSLSSQDFASFDPKRGKPTIVDPPETFRNQEQRDYYKDFFDDEKL